MPRLEDWSIVSRLFGPYDAPETGVTSLRGKIYDDEAKRFDDGTVVITSEMKSLDLKQKTAQTRNTMYKLGTVESGFEKFLKDNKFTLEQYEEKLNGNDRKAA